MADNQIDHEVRSSNTALLQKLASAVHGHAATATFACGGAVPLTDLSTGNFGSGAENLYPSVTLRWDSKDAYTAPSKITFPLPHHDDVSRSMLSRLLHHCEPATFGIGGKDVLDERYRKAAKLDTSKFSTNFHPHDYGIVDSIQQILLPSTIKGGQGVGIGPEGVRAELYKLNIYSAPSGKFLSHVDTPRGVLQFGSLVVCLPCQHEGGELRVKHRGETVDFAWGHPSPQSIQWAAFYGDCEHEVLEVTSGHRITLTYNLYYASIGKLAQPISTPEHLPLFDIARGILGFFCHHQYAHSQKSGRRSIPGAFKGVDLAVFSVFQALGLKVGVYPVMENRSENLGGLSFQDLMHPVASRPGDFVENCLEVLAEKPKPPPRDGGFYYYHKHEEEEEEDETTTIVGTHLHGPTFDEAYEEESREPVTNAWPHKKVPQIAWLNEPTHKEFAHAGLAYGNQAELNYRFSYATILIVVPARQERDFLAATPNTTLPDPRVYVAASSSLSLESTTSPSTVKEGAPGVSER